MTLPIPTSSFDIYTIANILLIANFSWLNVMFQIIIEELGGKISGYQSAPSIYLLPEEPNRQPRRRIREGI